jgi:hypothetical protein
MRKLPFLSSPLLLLKLWPGVFENTVFLLRNIKSPASGLITLPFNFQGDSHSPCTLPLKKEEVTFFQIKRPKGTGDTAGPWTLALNYV